jgi:hypothetical protein
MHDARWLIRTSTLYDKNRCCRRVSFESLESHLLLSILFVLFPSSDFPVSFPVFVSLSMSLTSLSAGDCSSRGFSRGPCVPGGSLPGRVINYETLPGLSCGYVHVRTVSYLIKPLGPFFYVSESGGSCKLVVCHNVSCPVSLYIIKLQLFYSISVCS